MKTPQQVLTEAADLLNDPAHWTKGAAARDADHRAVLANERRATCWCMTGALLKVVNGEESYKLFNDAVALASLAMPADRIWHMKDRPIDRLQGFNDSERTTHAEVVEVLRKAATL